MSSFGAKNATPSVHISPGFTADTKKDPFYGPNEEKEFNDLLKEQQHAAKLESLKGPKKNPLGNIKPDLVMYEPETNAAEADALTFAERQLTPQALCVTAYKSSGRNDIARVRANLHRQLKKALKEADTMRTINSLTQEQGEIAHGISKKDARQMEMDFGDDVGPMRAIINILVLARNQKLSELEENFFDIDA